MHSGAEPLHDVTSRYQMMHRVIQGERPSRPVGISPSVIEPSDSVWDLITQCWHPSAESRPQMDAVCKAMRIETAAKDDLTAVSVRKEASTGTQASTSTGESTSTMVSLRSVDTFFSCIGFLLSTYQLQRTPVYATGSAKTGISAHG
jgi:hypothetical protein